MRQLQIIEILKNKLKKYPNIISAILYGSFARNDANVNSDIDLGLLINESFNKNEFVNYLSKLFINYKIIHILHIELRNKVAIYFENIPKIEIALFYKIEDIKRNYHGSNIPSDLIDTTILFDKSATVKQFLEQLSNNNKPINYNKIVSDLVDKFIYEFESCSYNHSRSDGYKFYFFYNIAFHIVVQLKYLANKEIQFYFLPKNFLVKNITEKEKQNQFYELAGSTYLRDANSKKRKLLDFFYSAVTETNYSNFEKIKEILEKIYNRDFLWNFRDIAKFNSFAKPYKIFRTSSPTAYQKEPFFLKFLIKKKIKTIIDLRAENEIEKNPYKPEFIQNFEYIKAPFDPWNQPDWFKKTEHYGTNTEIAYRFFVKACKPQIKKIFDVIISSEDAVLVHCLAGKDRTGFVILLINMLLKTPYKIMLNDYLASELDAQEEKFKIYYDNILKEGGIETYLKSCRLTENELSTVKQKLKK